MRILITGAGGFVGKNLAENLKNIRDGKNLTRPELAVDEVYLFDKEDSEEALADYCRNCDFVFHLAGVNRPKDPAEFSGNADLTRCLLDALRAAGNTCPVMLSSSVQASLTGRYAGSPYGESKRNAEQLLFDYGKETGASVYVYRLPNLFGKWSRPAYNSVVATFCHNIARGLPVTVNDPAAELDLLYIDDLMETLLDLLQGRAERCDYDGLTPVITPAGAYCHAPGAYRVTVGEIETLLRGFAAQTPVPVLPDLPEGSFIIKLYSTYLSFLPPELAATRLEAHVDARGSFTELLKTGSCGQVSVNITEPGVTKGQHWHNSKWEFFIVVSGKGMIRQRSLDSDTVYEYAVTGEQPTAVRMLPGYTHSIQNLSDTEKLITVMWANERFDSARPDTFCLPV